MIRKLVLGAVAVAAIGFGGSAATAGEPFGGPTGHFPPQSQRHDHDYVVFVKRGHFGPWTRYGRYETRREAERVERYLEGRGHRARIEVVEGRRW